MTSVWVASDSTNQPERNCAGPEWNTQSMTPKVMKSLAAVVEQVVQQDLGRQHWQERQEQRRASGGQHVAEVAGRAHQRGGDAIPAGESTGRARAESVSIGCRRVSANWRRGWP